MQTLIPQARLEPSIPAKDSAATGIDRKESTYMKTKLTNVNLLKLVQMGRCKKVAEFCNHNNLINEGR
jgi:hypothetical protein